MKIAFFGSSLVSSYWNAEATYYRGLLKALAGLELSPATLESRGTHPDFGAVTLEQLLATWVVHDWNHVFQIVRVLSRQYEATVGPWKAYLKVLRV